MTRFTLCLIAALALPFAAAQAGQTGRDQLILSLVPQARSAGVDPAALNRLSTARLAQLNHYAHSNRGSGAGFGHRLRLELDRADGIQPFLLQLFGL